MERFITNSVINRAFNYNRSRWGQGMESVIPNTREVLCIRRSESKKGTVGEVELVGTGDGECDTHHPGSPMYKDPA